MCRCIGLGNRHIELTMLLKALSVVFFVFGCVALYYAEVALFIVPGAPSERYFSAWRIGPAALSIILGLALFSASSCLWKRAGSKRTFLRLFGATLILAFLALKIFWVCFVLAAHMGWA